MTVSRRVLLRTLAAVGIGSTTFQRALSAQVAEKKSVTAAMVAQAEWVAGLELDDNQREEVAEALAENLNRAHALRETPIDADTVPALVFRPDFFYALESNDGATASDVETASTKFNSPTKNLVNVAWSQTNPRPPLSDEDLAFARLSDQASLLQQGKISSRELTSLYLTRLKRYDPILHCVVTLLEEHALQSADASDRRRRHNQTIGVLDGIPWVAKDLIAVPPWKTTWGAEPFKTQVRPQMATVAERLDSSGCVLLAKVSLGTMAWGDQWHLGKTRNPWNPQQGSSGSSAGSASAVAAGLATFALGSETLGSIVSPCRRCRTSGLRPTFGRVSRAGCMPLAWSMDKIGPIGRHVEDLALVFASLLGQDGKDPTVVARGFQWPIEPSSEKLRIGIAGRLSPSEQKALEFLESLGATPTDLDLSTPLPEAAMDFILGVEASTVFDDAFRQAPEADYGNWPATFRQSQFIPAIQYLRANRLRGHLIAATEKQLRQVDVVLGGSDLLLTNLTGHPSIVVACDTSTAGNQLQAPGTIKLTAAAYREQMLLHVGNLVQLGLPPTPNRPSLDAFLAAEQSSQPHKQP